MKKLSIALSCLVLLLSACSPSSSSTISSSQPSSGSFSESAAHASTDSNGDGFVDDDSSGSSSPAASDSAADTAESVTIDKPFGSYSIPTTWYEEVELSDDSIAFYLKSGTPLDTPTSNITVSEGTNKYGEDDFQSFAQAIDQQLKMQVTSDVTDYHGSGSYTDKGYPLITMVIEDSAVITTQYYIVGDYRFVMVHSTDYHDENIPDTEDAALSIVNSFEWAE